MMPRFYIGALAGLLLSGAAWAQGAPEGDLPTVPTAPVTPPAATVPEVNLPAAAPVAAAPAVEPAPAATVAEPPTTGTVAAAPADGTTAALPAVPAEGATVSVTSSQDFSFGRAPNSLLFTPAQISNMKKALTAFETIRPDETAGEVTITEALPIEAVKIVEPSVYPVYQLSSIAYRTPHDWTVWLNNTRITPKMNDGEVKVTAVKPDRVWFTWQPAYMQVVVERVSKDKFANTDKVKHRFTSENTASFDRQTGVIRFSLKPNQSFAPGYFHTFEGRIAPPALDLLVEPKINATMTPQAAEAINGLLGEATPATPVASDRATMDELIANQRRMIPQPQQQTPATATTTPAP